MNLLDIVNKFQNPKKIGENSYQVRCNSHNDKENSLTISEKDDKILLYCHAGCSLDSILSNAGLKESDLFNNQKSGKPKIVKEYIYKDENNNNVFKVIRYEPKNFIQAKYDKDGKTVYKMDGVTRVLYNLPNVVKSDVVYFVEGEKDADNLNSIGLVATTSAGGAAGFRKYQDDYIGSLKDKTIYIVPDNDKAGYDYAGNVKKALDGTAKEVKILKLIDEIKDLKEKQDISDVLMKYGKEKTLEILEKLKSSKETQIIEEDVSQYEFTETMIFSADLMEKLYRYELNSIDEYLHLYGKIKEFCKKNRITGFDKSYKLYKDTKKDKYVYPQNIMIVPEAKNNITYNAGKYELGSDNCIYEIIPNVGKLLVSYQPLLPLAKYINIEDGLEKIKIGFLVGDIWKTLIVDKSMISTSQNIVKLSDMGLAATSENAKLLVKYLAEIENINKDVIPVFKSVSRMGWFDDVLLPYSDKYEFDNEKEMPKIKEKFSQKGELKDWINFFRERRKYNYISRIAIAAGVSSIILDEIKQNGFTVHIWGESEFGKTVACMVGQSIFGNPAQNEGKGIGINFNFTVAGLEYKLNSYNNLPLYINEMQHQKDARDYDKILFLVSEGKGRTRSTKIGGIAKENSWNNIVITNGEKNIIKGNSNAGAYNRCLSFEITNYSFDELSKVADFVKDNYGTPIRKILEELKNFDCKKIFEEYLDKLSSQETTNKQKILEAILMTGDKIVTDILFKDDYYLTINDLALGITDKKEIVVEERAFEYIKDWYVSEKRHFLGPDEDTTDNENSNKFEVYGKLTKDNNVAFISSILKDKLEDGGFDYNEVINAWRRKEYLKHSKDRNTLTVRINDTVVRCIVLKLETSETSEETVEENTDNIIDWTQTDLPF